MPELKRRKSAAAVRGAEKRMIQPHIVTNIVLAIAANHFFVNIKIIHNAHYSRHHIDVNMNSN